MALNGTHLKTASAPWTPWVTFDYDKNGNPVNGSGTMIDLMNVFSQKLNFTYSFYESPGRLYGLMYPNGTWNGMLGMMQREEVDFALGPFSVTYGRFLSFDFSVPVHVDSFGIFLPRPTLERDLAAFLKPFSWQVWIGILIFGFLCTLMGFYIDWSIQNWFLSSRSAGGQDIHDDIPQTFQPSWIIRLLSAEPIDIPTTMGITGRVFIGTWMLVSIIISSAYQGVLTSVLVAPKVGIPVDSIDDLINYGKIPWAAESGTAALSRLQVSTSGNLKRLGDKLEVICYVQDELERIKRGKLAVITDVNVMETIISDTFSESASCPYYIAKEKLWTVNLAMSFPKGSHLSPHFNKWITRMKEAGLVGMMIQEFKANSSACLVPPGKEGRTSSLILTMVDLAGIFLFFTGGITSGVLAFLFEILLEKLK